MSISELFRRTARRGPTSLLLMLCLAALSMPAIAQKRPARFVEPTTSEEAFLAARQAMLDDNADRFEMVATRAAEQPQVGDYLNYWRLRLRLNDRRPDVDTASLDRDAQRFIADRDSSLVADLARRDWIINLGRRGEWGPIDGLAKAWVLRDDNAAQCYVLTARAQKDGPRSGAAPAELAAQAREHLAQVRDLGDACTQLVAILKDSGLFKAADLRRRLLAAIEFNSPSSVRSVAGLMGLDPDRVDRALGKPALALAARYGGLYDLIALGRLARQDTSAAFERIRAASLNPADRAFAMSQLAAASMRKLDPEALVWARESLSADAGDETWPVLARAALRDQDWKTLRRIIARMSPELQREPTWVYWKARALKAEGQPEEAKILMRTIAGQYHFYGQLAAEDLGQLTNPPPRASTPTDEELAANDRNPGFARALRFYEMGLRFEGNREWNYQLRGMTDRELLAAAQWACRNRVLDRCVNTADRTLAEHDFDLRFIAPFREQLKPVALEMGLDPAWVYGLIRQESRFIMNARSSAGAQGLMQMMPATARWVAKRMGVSGFTVGQLNELDTNLRFGTFYLKTVLDDLEGSPLLASAAYNAGPGRPRNWRATLNAPVEGAIFAEIIPFNETRDYVKKVLSNATYYASLFTGQPQSLKERLGSVAPRIYTATSTP